MATSNGASQWNENVDFPQKLHALMVEKGLNNSELACKIWGKDRTGAAKKRDSIGKYKAGKATPTIKTVKELAHALDVKWEDLAPKRPAPVIEGKSPSIAVTVSSSGKVTLQFDPTLELTREIASKIIALALNNGDKNGE